MNERKEMKLMISNCLYLFNPDGRLLFYQDNVRNCRCARCAEVVHPGEGLPFKKANYSSQKNGYVCSACVGNLFREVKSWSFLYSLVNCYLAPASVHTAAPLLSEELAEAWAFGGLDGLADFLIGTKMG